MTKIYHQPAVHLVSMVEGQKYPTVCRRDEPYYGDPNLPVCRDCFEGMREDANTIAKAASVAGRGLETLATLNGKAIKYIENVQKITEMIVTRQPAYQCCAHCEHARYTEDQASPEKDMHYYPCREQHCVMGGTNMHEGKYADMLKETLDDLFNKVKDDNA